MENKQEKAISTKYRDREPGDLISKNHNDMGWCRKLLTNERQGVIRTFVTSHPHVIFVKNYCRHLDFQS